MDVNPNTGTAIAHALWQLDYVLVTPSIEPQLP
jgi:hypothetical protein